MEAFKFTVRFEDQNGKQWSEVREIRALNEDAARLAAERTTSTVHEGAGVMIVGCEMHRILLG